MKILPSHYIEVLCCSRLFKADHAYITYLLLNRQLSHLNCRKTDHRHNSAWPYTVNMFILMILYDLCLLPAHFCFIIVHMRKVESRVQIADRCAPWKISSGAESLVFQALQFKSECPTLIPRRGKHKPLLI
jgi:hypothetical protein